jgi:hypothetical protein
MEISFNACGLSFNANVDFTPGRHGTYWEPPEYPETEINELFVDGSDALFLLESNFEDSIKEAAHIAAPACRSS